MLSLSDALKVNWYRRFSANGRASRSEFWWMFGTYLICSVVLMTIMRMGSILALVAMVAEIALLAFTACAAARRLHDRNMAAWWLLLVFIPTFGQLILLILCALPGTQGPNKYGPDPLDGDFYRNVLGSGNNYHSNERYEWYQWQEGKNKGARPESEQQHFNPFSGHDEFGDQLKAQRRDDNDSDSGFKP